VSSPPKQIAATVVDGALDAWAESGRVSRLVVEGGSMLPLLQPGDVVEVQHSRRDLQRGDVVAYRTGRTLIIHRVLRTPGEERDIEVGGDNRTLTDEAVPLAAVIGRVVGVERGGERWRIDTDRARRLGRVITLLHPLQRLPALGRLVNRLRRALSGRLGR
jgi:signal peptidase I